MRARLCKMQESFAQQVFTTKLGTLCKIDVTGLRQQAGQILCVVIEPRE